MTVYKPQHPKQIDYQSIAEAIVRMAPAYRAPFVSVIGYSEALLEGLSGELQDSQKEDVASIRVCGWEALGYLNDVLDVMLIASGEIEYRIETLNMHQLIKDIVRDIERAHHTESKRLEVILDIDNTIDVRLDQMRLRQALLGLIGNSLTTVEDAKVQLTVTVSDEHVMLMLRDACHVASEDDYTYFFEPSWVSRLESNHWRQMQWQSYLTDQFVQAFGGEVWVSAIEANNEYPAGTQVTLQLPIAKDQTETQSSEAKPTEITSDGDV